jgi:hypothetical protein
VCQSPYWEFEQLFVFLAYNFKAIVNIRDLFFIKAEAEKRFRVGKKINSIQHDKIYETFHRHSFAKSFCFRM